MEREIGHADILEGVLWDTRESVIARILGPSHE